MIIRKLRLEQGWTQQELAQYGGLSIRTVQRIEKGQLPSEETAKCLGAVFGVESQDILDYYTHHQQPADNGGSQEQHTMSKISLSLEEECDVKSRNLKVFMSTLYLLSSLSLSYGS